METTDRRCKCRRGQSFLTHSRRNTLATLLLVRRDGAFRCFVWVFRSSSSSLPARSGGVLRRTSSFREVLLDKGPTNCGCKRLKRMIGEAAIHLVQLISQVSLRLRASSFVVSGFFIRLCFRLWIRIPSSGRFWLFATAGLFLFVFMVNTISSQMMGMLLPLCSVAEA